LGFGELVEDVGGGTAGDAGFAGVPADGLTQPPATQRCCFLCTSQNSPCMYSWGYMANQHSQ
jgi:hypothetical protein